MKKKFIMKRTDNELILKFDYKEQSIFILILLITCGSAFLVVNVVISIGKPYLLFFNRPSFLYLYYFLLSVLFFPLILFMVSFFVKSLLQTRYIKIEKELGNLQIENDYKLFRTCKTIKIDDISKIYLKSKSFGTLGNSRPQKHRAICELKNRTMIKIHSSNHFEEIENLLNLMVEFLNS